MHCMIGGGDTAEKEKIYKVFALMELTVQCVWRLGILDK